MRQYRARLHRDLCIVKSLVHLSATSIESGSVIRMATPMKTVLSVTARLYRGTRRPVLYGLFASVWIGASIAAAQSGGGLVQRLDSIAGAGVRENRAVGIVAAVDKGNDTLLLKAYGKAVVESDSPATVDTTFQIGSDTKQFTAAAILQLRDQGKLTLDDDITKWLPDFET